MIERIHLSILREVDQCGSLTAAAERLHLTQSALSHTMKKLELISGTALWTKQGRNLQLTQAGEFLLREANRLLPQVERLDETLLQFADGNKGSLRIGMECHPCYQWLLKVVEPFLSHWPAVDVDVKQKFQFGGMAALYNHDIDMLVTPDPIVREGINFSPVFNYELVLLVSNDSPLAENTWVTPEQLNDQTLYTYPVSPDRLDIYQQFLLPANCRPKQHKAIEATEIMLQLVAANRGVTCLPDWLARECQKTLPIQVIKLGLGIDKQIHLGFRAAEIESPFRAAFIKLAKETSL